ncbi:hypothetical protein KUTeg_001336 [Tegillarca granosa]|uniref:Uncharacterized protein n=1 Tax=Tegillarca granosa TaxID=220873 RepID=A0ABQ9FR47_TEGGR|nr:hypothetical protein KUTeg_001336 [Tegillarca granosa]
MREGTKPDKGWAWMVMIASLGIHIVNGCFLYSMGIIHNALLDQFEESVTLTSWASSLVLGLISSTGLGIGLTYVTSVVVVGLNFDKKRSIAGGIATSGCAIGTFIFPPILTLAEQHHGYRGLFIVLAAISLHSCLFGALLRPSCLELQIQKENFEEKKPKLFLRVKKCLLLYWNVIQNKSVIAMCVSTFTFGIGVYLTFLHFPHYVILKKTSPLKAAFLLTIAGVCGTISRVLTGIVGNFDRVPEMLLYGGSFGLIGISTLLLPFYSFGFSGQVFYALTLGLFSGNCYPLFNSINVQFIGVENLAVAYGMEMFFCGIGSFVGPILAGSALSISALSGILAQYMNKTVHKVENDDQPYTIDSGKISTHL